MLFFEHSFEPGQHTLTQTLHLWIPQGQKPDTLDEPADAKEVSGSFTVPPIEFELLERNRDGAP